MKLAFAHNVYNRPKTLNETIRIERELYPDSTISVAYNNCIIENHFLSGIKYIYYPQESHKIGCTNGFILSIRNIIDSDFDVCCFSHDDVRISNINVFKRNLDFILNNEFDIICRTPGGDFGNKYIMMECVFFNKKTIVKIFENLKPFNNEFEIPVDHRGSISPEVWFGNLLYDSGLKMKLYITPEVKQEYYNSMLNEIMGFEHLNSGIRGWDDNFKI